MFTYLLLALILYVAYKLIPKKRNRSSTAYKGQVIIITGASSGIGHQLAIEYAKMGATLVISARREEELKQLSETCQKQGAKDVLIIKTDVSKEDDCKNLIEKSIEKFGKIDILCLNAGVSSLLYFSEFKDLESQKRIFDINYWGCVYCTFYARKYLIESKGKICVTSSLLGKQAAPSRTAYSASKHALHGFFNSLRMELLGQVQVTIVCPGFVYSEIHQNALGNEKGFERKKEEFMSAEECAFIMIGKFYILSNFKDAIEDGVAEEVMTLKGKMGVYIKPFFPNLIDSFAMKQIQSVKRKE